MIGTILLMMGSAQAAEVTPSLDSLTLSTASLGTCLTTPLQPASIRLDWTSTNFVAGIHDFKIYRDGILVATTDSSTFSVVLSGLVENDSHNQQDITFNYRVAIVRTSDNAQLATRSVSVTKHYGTCA